MSQQCDVKSYATVEQYTRIGLVHRCVEQLDFGWIGYTLFKQQALSWSSLHVFLLSGLSGPGRFMSCQWQQQGELYKCIKPPFISCRWVSHKPKQLSFPSHCSDQTLWPKTTYTGKEFVWLIIPGHSLSFRKVMAGPYVGAWNRNCEGALLGGTLS